MRLALRPRFAVLSTLSAAQIMSFQLYAAPAEMAVRTIDGETPTRMNPTPCALATLT
jgi:hypothetical protein